MERGEEEAPRPGTLRSINDRVKSYVRFKNTTRHRVIVCWIDYQAKPVYRTVLGPNDFIDFNTFVTHPYIFVEEDTRDRYLVNGKTVYFPEPWFAKYRGLTHAELLAQVERGSPRIERTEVRISLPMYTLRELCLREIKRRLSYDRHAMQLEIPLNLRRELYDMHPRKPG